MVRFVALGRGHGKHSADLHRNRPSLVLRRPTLLPSLQFLSRAATPSYHTTKYNQEVGQTTINHMTGEESMQ